MTPSTRFAAVDLARGLAVVSMVVAHTAPVGGIFNISEYLTAPLFALLVGVGQRLSWEQHPRSFASFWASEAVRGATLAVIGVALQFVYDQIVVVLIPLGLLMAALPPLVLLGTRLPVGLGIVVMVLAIAMPLARITGTEWLTAHGLHGLGNGYRGPADPLGQVLFWGVAHPYYRLTSFLVAAGLGVLLTPIVRTTTRRPRHLLAVGAAAATAASGFAIWLGKRTGWGGEPYDGTWPELTASTLIAVAALLASIWLWEAAPRIRPALHPLVATGRLALSSYALHIIALAMIVAAVLDGGRDDHWWVLITVTVLVVTSATLWQRFVSSVGPLEWVLRLPRALTRRARHV